jgi:hypothetical protein
MMRKMDIHEIKGRDPDFIALVIHRSSMHLSDDDSRGAGISFSVYV